MKMNDQQLEESLALAEQDEKDNEFRPTEDELADADYCLAYLDAGQEDPMRQRLLDEFYEIEDQVERENH